MTGSKEQFEQERLLSYLDSVAESSDDGHGDPLYDLYVLGQIEKKVKETKSVVKAAAMQEAENHEKTFEHRGLKFEKRNGRKVWNFKGIQEYDLADAAKKEVEAKYKSAYSSYQKGITPVDPETGEQLDIPEVHNADDVLVIKS